MQEKKIKKVNLDQEKCIGCGACGVIAPDAFGLDETKGKSFVKPGAENVEDKKLEDAASGCPVQAITLEK
jgi:ferredoxin